MDDALGKLFAVFLGAVMMFIVPVMIMGLKQDDTKQTYIDDAVVEFVDNARASGEITRTAYEKLTSRIDSTNELCDVKINYSSSYAFPEIYRDGAGNVIGIDYKRHLQEYNKSDIVNYIYKENSSGDIEPRDFPLKEGGYLSVEVKNTYPTFGQRMLNLFLPIGQGQVLNSSYGGYVGNNKQ